MKKKSELTHCYSQSITNQTIAILGIYPPPLGGVSVHIKRVMQVLAQQHNTVHFFLTESRYRYRLFWLYLVRVALWLLWYRPTQVHYHSVYLLNSVRELQLLVWLKKILNYHLVVVDHDPRHMYRRNEREKKTLNKLFTYINHYVLIGTSTYQSYIENDMAVATRACVESAFLPPPLKDETAIVASYPPSIHHFFKTHTPIILANASQLVLLNDRDLYGIDATILLLHVLKKAYPAAGLCIALSQVGNEHYFKKLTTLIEQKKLNESIYLLIGQFELWPLFKRADLFVRPTLSDGASVSVHEADYFDVPIVASAVGTRPQRAYLFDVGNSDAFITQCQNVLAAKGGTDCIQASMQNKAGTKQMLQRRTRTNQSMES